MQCMDRINLLVSVCLCVRHTFCQLSYDILKDADLRKDVHFGGLDDE